MKSSVWPVVFLLMAGVTAWGQEEKPPASDTSSPPGGQRPSMNKPAPDEQRPTLGKPGPDDQRPTLGKSGDEPSLRGGHSYAVLDVRKLEKVHKVYVQRIDNFLNDKLVAGLTQMGRFKIVEKSSEADAVVRGTCFDSRRLKSVHTEIFIADAHTDKPIWQDDVRVPYKPASLEKAVNDTASQILQHLTESLQVANRQ